MKNLKIIVLPRGWVMIGECTESAKKIICKNASVIRRWGTTAGLPQLANEGPTANTVLDGKCEMEFPMSAVIATMKCNAKAWGKY